MPVLIKSFIFKYNPEIISGKRDFSAGRLQRAALSKTAVIERQGLIPLLPAGSEHQAGTSIQPLKEGWQHLGFVIASVVRGKAARARLYILLSLLSKVGLGRKNKGRGQKGEGCADSH